MKSVRSKRSVNNNVSFLSNHDLLQNFRNKSFKLITRDNSINNDFKQSNKKVNLIKKKSYQKFDLQQINFKQKQNNMNLNNQCKNNNLKNKNNNNLSVNSILNINKTQSGNKNTSQIQYDTSLPIQHNILNIKNKNTPKSVKDNNYNINKIIKQLNFVYDQINNDEVQIRMILNKNIKKIKQLFDSMLTIKRQYISSQFSSVDKQSQEKTLFFQKKIQQQSKIILKLKSQNQSLQKKDKIDAQMIKTLKIKLRKSKQENQQILSNLQSPQKHQNSISSFISPIQSKRMNSYIEYHNSKGLSKIQQKNNISLFSYEQKNKNLLEQIITSQTQLINKQSKEFEQQNQTIYRLLKCQAETIQGFLLQRKINQDIQLKNQRKQNKFNRQKVNYSSASINKKYNSCQRKDNLSMKYNKSTNSVLRNPSLKNAQYSICLY